jgi:hypothetical protein
MNPDKGGKLRNAIIWEDKVNSREANNDQWRKYSK